MFKDMYLKKYNFIHSSNVANFGVVRPLISV